MRNNKYFNLKEDCYLVNGKLGYSIYDLNNNKIIHIDKDVGKYLEYNAYRINNKIISDNNKLINDNEKIKYLNELCKHGVGFISNKRVLQEIMEPKWSLNKDKLNIKAKKIDKMWIEITRKCNFRCIHCNDNKTYVSRCACSKNENNESKIISKEYILNAINDAAIFGCNEIVIIGGEPLLEKMRVFEYIKYANKYKINNIILKTNMSLIDDNIFDKIMKYNVILNTTIYSHNEKVHDKITGREGSWKKTMKNILLAYAKNIRIYIELEILSYNEDMVKETIGYFNRNNIKISNIKFVYSNDRRIWPYKYTNKMIINKKSISKITKNTYFFNKERNSCWYGKIAISDDGFILPCIMARRYIISHIRNNSIRDIMLNDMINDYWLLTTDNINNCKNCEFRYTCFICRPIQSIDGSIFGANRLCQIYENERLLIE